MLRQEARILIVEEMIGMQKLIGKIFQSIGYQNLNFANSVAQAWSVLSISDPRVELVCANLEMSGESGLVLLGRMRGNMKVCDTPFVMMALEDRTKSLADSGIDGILTKPFGAAELKQLLGKLDPDGSERRMG